MAGRFRALKSVTTMAFGGALLLSAAFEGKEAVDSFRRVAGRGAHVADVPTFVVCAEARSRGNACDTAHTEAGNRASDAGFGIGFGVLKGVEALACAVGAGSLWRRSDPNPTPPAPKPGGKA